MVEWNGVSISKPDQLRKDVDAALYELEQAVGDADPGVAAIVDSIRQQIRVLETFHADHNDDERIDLFEEQRLRLQRAIQPRMGPGSSSDSVHSHQSGKLSINELSAGSGSRGGQSQGQQSRRTISSKGSSSTTAPSMGAGGNNGSSGRIQDAGLNVSPGKVFSASGMRQRPSVDPLGRSVASKDDPNRDKIVEGITYLPTNMAGYYIRQDAPQVGNNDKYIDFQIILTQDELNTLIQRKKALLRMNGGINSATTGTPNKISIQASTPYIDPSRHFEYRPIQQDKWVGKK